MKFYPEISCRPPRYMFKFLLVMKLIIVLLTTAILQVSASTYAQKVTLNTKDAPLTKVFKEITQQTNYTFLYTAQMLQNSKPVTLNIKALSLDEALKECFADQPLTYTVKDQVIVVALNEETNLPNKIKAVLPPKTIIGNVTNSRGEPLPGASVLVKRTKSGTLTDPNGRFTLNNILPADTLIISFIGFQKQEVHVGDRENIPVALQEATNSLDQVVVQGYGETSQRLTTSDIGRVTAADIEKQPVMNPLLALQGKVAGLDVNQTSGYASAPVKLELRGRGAISNNFHSDPLYVIDGVPLTIVSLNDGNYLYGSPGFLQNGLGGPAGGQSPLFNINPSDIESIEILKDADATAIYGSRGANGVVLITTKKGKAGKTQFDAKVDEGVTKVSRFWQMMNTQQYITMRKEAFKNDGMKPNPAADFDINGTWDTTRYTDWQKALFGGMGHRLDAQTSLSGGDNGTTFRLSAGYNRTTNILAVSGADQRASVSLSLVHRSLDQRFSAAFTADYSYTQSDMVQLPGAIRLAPDAPAIFDAAGNLNYAGWGGVNNNATGRQALTPFASLLQPYQAGTNFLNSNLVLSYQLIKGLSLSSSFGYNNAQAGQTYLYPIASFDPATSPTGSESWGSNSNKNWIIEPQLTYNTLISKGKLAILLGASSQQTNTDGVEIYGTGYTSDDLLGTLSSAPNLRTNQSSGEYRYAAIFGRVSYNWENKYLINISGRRDGSSRFGPGKQFGNFGSVGAAWIFTEENWFKDHLPLLSFGKLKMSYGTTGSDAVGDYQYLTQYSSTGTFPYAGITSLHPTVEANPNYQWQVNKKLEGGINLGFLQDRILLQVNYYRDICSNQLIDYSLPAFTGFQSVTANSGATIENKGWEFTASATLVDTKKFRWSMDFNMAINRNTLLAYPNIAQSPYAGLLIVGQSLNIQKVLHFVGVDPLTGQYAFYDKNNDGKITVDNTGQKQDDTYPVDLSPKFFGGLGFNFKYEDFQLSLFFSYKKQIGRNSYSGAGAPGTINSNMPVEALSRWQKPGDMAPFAAYITDAPYNLNNIHYLNNSDGIYTDASFIRLSNLSFSYNLSQAFARKIGLKGARLFVNANNLLLITEYKGIDPEIQNFGALPPTRTVSGGISLNF